MACTPCPKGGGITTHPLPLNTLSGQRAEKTGAVPHKKNQQANRKKGDILQYKIQDGPKAKKDLFVKYEATLPAELLNIWKKYGFATLLDGYLRVIDPDDYQELLMETYFRGKVSIPILSTAFGDIITLEEGQYIGIVQYKNGRFGILTKGFHRFLSNLTDDYFTQKYFEPSQYRMAVERLGKLGPGECFGYVPLLGLGGTQKIENLRKVKCREHIELISQLVGKIGM